MAKKIMFLGGAEKSLELIEYANEQGYNTYLCDNTENPGQYLVKHNYKTSAADVEGVSKIIIKENIDGVLSYSSDYLATIQSQVAEKCGLYGNSVESTLILTEKDLFRKFLRKHNFNDPFIATFTKDTFNVEDERLQQYPIMIKPVDSAGSSGVTKVLNKDMLQDAFDYALSYSRSGKVIAEKFIVNKYPYVIAGDVFVSNNKVVFYGLMDELRNNDTNPFLPLGTFSHLFITGEEEQKVKAEIARLVKEVGFEFGGMNVEMMIDENDDVYFLELAPRNGGNRISDQLAYAYGVNIKEMLVDSAVGNKFDFIEHKNEKITAIYILHSYKNGVLKDIVYDDLISDKIVAKWDFVDLGSKVEYFENAKKAIGFVMCEFDTTQQLEYFLKHHNELIKVEVK